MIILRSVTFLGTVGIVLIVVISILGFFNLNINSNVNDDQNNIRQALQDQNPSNGSLKILNHQMTKTLSGEWTVKGTAKNVGSGTLQYVTINVNFYKNGYLFYSNFANLHSIAPGETKDFEVTCRGPNSSPDSYDLSLGSTW